MNGCDSLSSFSAEPLHTHFKRQIIKPGFIALVCFLFVSLANAQTNRIAAMRELRIACLETFSATRDRLEELRSFVDQQTDRQHGVADQLFQLQQNAASAKRNLAELQQKQTAIRTEFDMARIGISRAVASRKVARQSLPTGDAWADDGAKALTDLRRAADAAPRDQWKHRRVKEAESEFAQTLRDWRAARREFERTDFDLNVRAATVVFERISNQLATASAELKSLDAILSERARSVSLLETNSEKWSKIIRDLNSGEAEATKRLAEVASDFHLVDLKFTAWRLNQAGLAEEGLSALPDLLERQTARDVRAGGELGNAPMAGIGSQLGDASAAATHGGSEPAEKAGEEPEETDAKFRELLDRVNLANGRLQFLLDAWKTESANVEVAIYAVESADEKTKALVDETAALAASLESLRRTTESTGQNLSAGLATVDLVQKRFAAEIGDINRLLDNAVTRTGKLRKSLEQL